MAKMKIKKNDLNEYANEAVAMGMTYGQRQAKEYIAQMKRKPIPKGYRKIGKSGNTDT